MHTTEFFLVSSLEKVMPTRRPVSLSQGARLSAWKGTRAAVQLVYYSDGLGNGLPSNFFSIEVTGGPVSEKRYKVDLVPVEQACFESADNDFISRDPGLFPDVLSPLEETYIKLFPRQYRSIWLSWEIPEDTVAGDYEVHVQVRFPAVEQIHGKMNPYEDALQNVTDLCFILSVKNAVLQKQKQILETWFHADCLAKHYNVEVFSEEHWAILDKFICAASERHYYNTLLTPVFTPPYDTAMDTDRPTTQLVRVYVDNGVYTFQFDQLERWVSLCRKYGVENLEIPAFFTQWGAKATPKIVAIVDGVEKQIFGWDVPATSTEYRRFLLAFVPALRKKMEELGYDNNHLFFKISDEPGKDHLEDYTKARNQLEGLLDDALYPESVSDVDFVKSGIVKIPVIPIDVYDKFEDLNLEKHFVYYCCAQDNKVPNRFIAMESARNRIMGVLLYLTDPTGFYHWGYNFYYSSYSVYQVDPYRSEHSDWCFPAGDAYLVYPGKDGEVISSIRAEVQDDAIIDLRALQTLEKLTSRAYVEELIHEGTDIGRFTYTNYPHEPEYLLNLRERVAEELDKYNQK